MKPKRGDENTSTSPRRNRLHFTRGSGGELLLKSTRNQKDGTGLTNFPQNPELDTNAPRYNVAFLDAGHRARRRCPASHQGRQDGKAVIFRDFGQPALENTRGPRDEPRGLDATGDHTRRTRGGGLEHEAGALPLAFDRREEHQQCPPTKTADPRSCHRTTTNDHAPRRKRLAAPALEARAPHGITNHAVKSSFETKNKPLSVRWNPTPPASDMAVPACPKTM